MNRIMISMLVGLLVLFFSQCDNAVPAAGNIELDSNFSKSTSVFAFNFLQKLESENSNENFFVSPLGLNMALGMLMNGSANESEKQLRSVLSLNGMSTVDMNKNYANLIKNLPKVDPKVTNTLANSLWQRQGFQVEKGFKNELKSSFAAELFEEPFDSGTISKINKWASDNTNKKIEQVLDEISDDMVMFLMNAIYFKGDWQTAFDPKQTKQQPFYAAGQSTEVAMMQSKAKYAYADLEGFKALEIPYGNGQYLMRVLLPEADLNTLITSLNAEKWQHISQALTETKVDLRFPKIKMSYEKKLNNVLIKMGMPVLFGSSADLSKIAPPAGKLAVSFVKQNAFVEIDEKGTEAAAVTTIGIELTSVGPETPTFICNKPFVFFIYEKTSGTIQFVGKIKEIPQ